MKSVTFPEQTHVLAKDQPQYNPLPVRRLPDGTTTSCWQLELADLERLGLEYPAHSCGKLPLVYVTQLTFGAPLQPLMLSTVLPPDCFQALTLPGPTPPAVTPQLPPAPKLSLEDIKHCRGLSQPILWAIDKESRPGFAICHFLRLETQHLTDTGQETKFATMTPEADPRLVHLADCFTSAPELQKANLLKVLILVEECLAQVKGQAVMQSGTAKRVDDTLRLCTTAIGAYAT